MILLYTIKKEKEIICQKRIMFFIRKKEKLYQNTINDSFLKLEKALSKLAVTLNKPMQQTYDRLRKEFKPDEKK